MRVAYDDNDEPLDPTSITAKWMKLLPSLEISSGKVGGTLAIEIGFPGPLDPS